MNIMRVLVTERTREIGIRLAHFTGRKTVIPLFVMIVGVGFSGAFAATKTGSSDHVPEERKPRASQ